MNKKIELLTKLKDLFEEYNVEVYAEVELEDYVVESPDVILSIEDKTDGTQYLSTDSTSIDVYNIKNELVKES